MVVTRGQSRLDKLRMNSRQWTYTGQDAVQPVEHMLLDNHGCVQSEGCKVWVSASRTHGVVVVVEGWAIWAASWGSIQGGAQCCITLGRALAQTSPARDSPADSGSEPMCRRGQFGPAKIGTREVLTPRGCLSVCLLFPSILMLFDCSRLSR